jgi:thiamine biosynthesis lipoprotein
VWEGARSVHGVEVRVTARDADEARARAAIEEALSAAAETGALLLAERPASEIDILMRAPSHLWIEVSPATAEALLEASQIAEATDGAFDPTFPPLLTLWGLRGGREPRVPRAFEIDMTLRKVDWTDIELEFDGSPLVRRMSRRTEIDLAGLARGAMLDAAVERLRAAGVPAGRASTAREHAVYGGRQNRPWPIEVLVRSRAASGADARVGRVQLVEGGLAIASLGPTLVAADGTQIHDRFDPRTGHPARGTQWTAVTAERASTAAAYAAAIFAMGEEGPGFVATQSALRAVVVSDSGEIFVSRGVEFEAP